MKRKAFFAVVDWFRNYRESVDVRLLRPRRILIRHRHSKLVQAPEEWSPVAELVDPKALPVKFVTVIQQLLLNYGLERVKSVQFGPKNQSSNS